jgi:hypothetical protein
MANFAMESSLPGTDATVSLLLLTRRSEKFANTDRLPGWLSKTAPVYNRDQGSECAQY